MNRNAKPTFADYEIGPDFDRARSQIATPFQYLDIDLTNAGTNVVYPIAGDFIYVDAASTGTATLEINNQYNDPAAPFLIQANFALNAVFKQIKLSWSAQVSKKIRLMYSTGERVIPTSSGVSAVTISGTPTVQLSNGIKDPEQYNLSFKQYTACAALTPETILAPASNTNGAYLLRAKANSYSSGSSLQTAFIAKSSAPTSMTDGDVLDSSLWVTETGWTAVNEINTPIFVPSGIGIYFLTNVAISAGPNSFRSALIKKL